MKKFITFLKTATLICGAAVVLTIVSCNKTEIQPTGEKIANEQADVYVKNGVLTFNSTEAFTRTIEKINLMTDSELDKWEESLAFTSIRRLTMAALDELDCANTEEQFNATLAKYSDLLIERNDAIETVYPDLKFASILNVKGQYNTPEFGHLYFPGEAIIIAPLNEITKITSENYQESKSSFKLNLKEVVKKDSYLESPYYCSTNQFWREYTVDAMKRRNRLSFHFQPYPITINAN